MTQASAELLPLKVATLDNIPQARRGQYVPAFEGGFRLGRVNSVQDPEYLKYLSEVADGRIVVGDGARESEADRVARENKAAFERALAERMAKAEVDRVARIDAELAEERKRRVERVTPKDEAAASELARIEAEITHFRGTAA